MLTRLPTLGVAQITGSDAVSFMQAHFCNDVQDTVPGRIQLSGYCSPKGRLLAVFHLAHITHETGEAFLLVAPRTVLKPMLDRLSMFAKMARPAGKQMFAKVTKTDIELEDCSEELLVLGVAGQDALDTVSAHLSDEPQLPAPGEASQHDSLSMLVPLAWHPAGATPQRMERMERMVCIGREDAIARIEAATNDIPTVTEERWLLEDIRAGVPVVLPDTLDQFVPQMVNMHRLSGLSFTKGCYPGQEIVARMQYLGKLKRRTERFSFTGDAMDPGTPVVDTSGAEAGTVMVAASSEGAGEALVVVRLASSSGALFARRGNDEQVPLTNLPLPYTLDDAAESSA